MPLHLPCGGCLGCRMANAKAWALRCSLELKSHQTAAFTTVTYDQERLPPTLQKRDLQLWLKRLRRASARSLRYFACGEYGENFGRPHYHAIIFGLSDRDQDLVEATWGLGRTHTGKVTPASISYVAGYTSKKIGWARQPITEQVDFSTGEVYKYQPPFIQMSRRPGIGGRLRYAPGMGPHTLSYIKQHTQSWRLYAIQNGYKQPVPRFLHEAYKLTASAEELEELLAEKSALSQYVTSEQLRAAEQNAIAKQSLTAAKRRL